MKIIKASAGSGKTYSLAKEYLRTLLLNPERDGYRHILAVTFTNMATGEMKRRILKELHTLATRPDQSAYLADFVPAVCPDKAALQQKASSILKDILHDYSSFAVSTIDKFFQQTLRAFSREIGQFASYEVELDKQGLIDETVERILDSLTAEGEGGAANPLLEWIINGVKNDLLNTGKFTLEHRLTDLATGLLSPDAAQGEYAKDDLLKLRDTCDDIILSFTEKVSDGATAIIAALVNEGIDPAETNHGFLKNIGRYQDVDVQTLIPAVSASFIDKASDPDKWFAKSKSGYTDRLRGVLDPALDAFTALFGKPYQVYTTARTLKSQVYGLGLASEVRRTFTAIQRDKNVLTIDDSNEIIHEIIDGTDTPFIYEKLGVRYENFLLDEFQDISSLQWDNFLPLLRNSEAEGHDTLVVGDVKQSIYRWRGSDWRLLGGEVENTFNVPASDVSVLDTNWRSLPEVVGFNNDFFPYAAKAVDAILGLNPDSEQSVTAIYKDVRQQVHPGSPAPGRVSAVFLDDVVAEMDEMVSSVREAMGRGARPGDIAILVRGNAEGSEIALRLVQEGIPVMSDDALHVKSSVVVRRLLSLLSVIENPAGCGEHSIEGFLASSLDVAVPERYDTLSVLVEGLLKGLRESDPALYDSEQAHVCAFMDHLHDWEKKNDANIGSFLRDWEKADPKVPTPADSDAVHVLTIHKSKGLEFPLVIVPFAEKITLYRYSSYWKAPQVQGTALESVATGRFRVNLSEGSADTLFHDDFRMEQFQQGVDNLNILYVGLTRARCELRIIAQRPGKSAMQSLDKGSVSGVKNFAQILYAFLQSDDYSTGEPFDYYRIKRPLAQRMSIPLDYTATDETVATRVKLRIPKPEPEESGNAVEDDAPATEVSQAESVAEPTLF